MRFSPFFLSFSCLLVGPASTLGACTPVKLEPIVTAGDDASMSDGDASDTSIATDTMSTQGGTGASISGAVTDGEPGDATGAETADESGTETDDPGDPSTGAEPGEVPQGPPLHCDGAAWVTTVAPGDLSDLVLDAQGRTIGFGEYAVVGDADPAEALVVELDPAGAVVRLDRRGISWAYDIAVAGGLDASGNVYALFIEQWGHRFWLRKFEPAGALVKELELEGDPQGIAPYDLAVGPDGTLVVSADDMIFFNDNVLTRFTPDLEVEWTQVSDKLHVRAVNAAGLAIATRWSEGLAVLDADGGTVWSVDWKLLNEGDVDINDAGQVVIGGKDEDLKLSVARFDSDGGLVWDKHFTIFDQFDQISDVAINEASTIAVAGAITDQDPMSGFALKFNANGDLVAQHNCGHGSNGGFLIDIDAAGGLRFASMFSDSVNLWAYVAAFD